MKVTLTKPEVVALYKSSTQLNSIIKKTMVYMKSDDTLFRNIVENMTVRYSCGAMIVTHSQSDDTITVSINDMMMTDGIDLFGSLVVNIVNTVISMGTEFKSFDKKWGLSNTKVIDRISITDDDVRDLVETNHRLLMKSISVEGGVSYITEVDVGGLDNAKLLVIHDVTTDMVYGVSSDRDVYELCVIGEHKVLISKIEDLDVNVAAYINGADTSGFQTVDKHNIDRLIYNTLFKSTTDRLDQIKAYSTN